MCKSLILVGSFSLYGQCVYVIMSVCHYVIMLVLSSAHYGQCVCVIMSVSLFHYAIMSIITSWSMCCRLSLHICQFYSGVGGQVVFVFLSMYLRLSSYFGQCCFGLSYFFVWNCHLLCEVRKVYLVVKMSPVKLCVAMCSLWTTCCTFDNYFCKGRVKKNLFYLPPL